MSGFPTRTALDDQNFMNGFGGPEVLSMTPSNSSPKVLIVRRRDISL